MVDHRGKKPSEPKGQENWGYSPESYKLPPIDNILPTPKVQPLKPDPVEKDKK